MKPMTRRRALAGAALVLSWCLVGVPVAAQAGQPATKPSANEIADQLANPNAALGILNFPIDFVNYGGTLPDAGGQNAFKISAQPIFPYPVARGANFFLRPLLPVVITQPVPTAAGFDGRGVALGDIGFDAALGWTHPLGLTLIGGAVGAAPTATDSALGLHQWLLGPELLVGYKAPWGFVGVLVTQQWRIGGSNDASTSITGGQYLYTVSVGGGWQITAQPVYSYNHNAPEGDKLTFPLGTGVAKTVILGATPLKLGLQYWYYIAKPEAFGPRHQVRLQLTPVIPLPW